MSLNWSNLWSAVIPAGVGRLFLRCRSHLGHALPSAPQRHLLDVSRLPPTPHLCISALAPLTPLLYRRREGKGIDAAPFRQTCNQRQNRMEKRVTPPQRILGHLLDVDYSNNNGLSRFPCVKVYNVPNDRLNSFRTSLENSCQRIVQWKIINIV